MSKTFRVLWLWCVCSSLCASVFAQTYTISPQPVFQFFTNAGLVCNGCQLHTYSAGTSSPIFTYLDSSGTPNTNPIILDSAGRAVIYLAQVNYKFELDDANGVTIWTQDNVGPVPSISTTTALPPFYYGMVRSTAISTTMYCVQTGPNPPDSVLEVTGSATVAITLDSVSNCHTGRFFDIKNKGTGRVTVSSSDTIDGAASYIMGNQGSDLTLYVSPVGDWSIQ